MAGFIFDTSIDSSETLSRALDRISHRGQHREAFRVGKYFLGIVYSDEDYFELTDTHIYLIDGYLFDKPAGIKLFKDRHFNEVNGGWAGLIVDFQNQVVTVARDRWGEAPAYYNLEPHFAIASERKAFLDTKTNPITTELLITRHYLDYDYETKTTNIVEYYKTPDYVPNGKDFKTVVRDMRDLAESSVDRLLKTSTDIVVAVGGVDSSAVTYMLTERGIKPELLVVSYGDSKLKRSDLYGARLLSKELNLTLHEVLLEEKDLFSEEVMHESVYAFEYSGWQNTSISACFVAMARKAKELGAKNIYTGMMIDILLGSMGPMEAWYYDPKKYIPKRQKDLDNIDTPPDGIGLNKTFLFGGGCLEKTPFVNYDFVDYCLTIPIEYRKVNGKNKASFRYAFEGELSDSILFRPKISSVKGSNMFDSYKALGKGYYDSIYRSIFDNAIK